MRRNASQASSDDANVPKVAPPIVTNDDLDAILTQYQNAEFLAVDTEFLRERTYYSKLCLLQLAMPGKDDDTAVLVDPLSEGLSLAPLYDLFCDTSVVKVFHAARQDLEIFFVDAGVFPDPLFDTQVASYPPAYQANRLSVIHTHNIL